MILEAVWRYLLKLPLFYFAPEKSHFTPDFGNLPLATGFRGEFDYRPGTTQN